MLKGRWLEGIVTSRKDFSVVFTLLFNVFTWYYMVLMLMSSIALDASKLLALSTIFYTAAIGSSLAGSLFSESIKKMHFLSLWMAMGVTSSFMLTFVNNVTAAQLSMILIALGISFGLGMPSCLSYLADCTSVENRGRVSAIVFAAANLSAFPLALLLASFDLVIGSIILTLWRALGLVIFVSLKPEEKESMKATKHTPFEAVLRDRNFVLYIIPWLMFSLIDGFEKTILKGFFGPDFHRIIVTTEPLIASLAMLVGGLLCDRIGRKRVVIYGFVSLGIAYAIIGIAPLFTIAWYFYLVIDGIAAGILWITFILILWGDLSQQNTREKYYVMGSFPFLARNMLPLLVPLAVLVPTNAAFSVASFFLFLAVLPLMYAPETLPERKIELRRLKSYVEQAKKLGQKTH